MKNQTFLLLTLLVLCFSPGKGQTIISLEQAMEIAEKNSPTLQSTLFNMEVTTELLNAQRAALKSNFSLNLAPVAYSNARRLDSHSNEYYTSNSFGTGGTFAINQPILATDGTLSLTNNFSWNSSGSSVVQSGLKNQFFQNILNLSLTQPLFTYNRTKTNIKTLELANETARLNYAMQRLALEKAVAQYFYNVYLAQMNLTIKQDELTNTQKSYDIIKNKADAGLSALGELYQAEVSLANAKSGVEIARVNLESTKDQLKQYIGMDIFEDMAVVADVQVTTVAVDEKKALEHGLASRMEIRQREINVENSLFDMLKVKAQNEFRGDMKISVGMTGADSNFSRVFQNQESTPTATLGFNIPLFDWGEKKARIRSQEAVINIQKLGVTTQQTQIKVDIRQSVRNLGNLKDQIQIALVTQKNSQLTYDINLERYKNGDLTSMDLNLFQQQLSSSKMSYAQALINYKMELLNLKIQSLYDFLTNEPVFPDKYISDYFKNKK